MAGNDDPVTISLIHFENPYETPVFLDDKVSNGEQPRKNKTISDLEQVFNTKMEGYVNRIPFYQPYDFLRDAHAEFHKTSYEKNVENTNLVVPIARSGSSSSTDDTPPPLPPKRRKSSSESDLLKRLSMAGIILDDYQTSLSCGTPYLSADDTEGYFEGQRNLPRPKSCDSGINTVIETKINFNLEAFDGIAVSRNVLEVDTVHLENLETKISQNLSPDKGHELNSLSTEDLKTLEDVSHRIKSVSLTEADDQPTPPPRPPLPKSNRFSCPPDFGLGLNPNVDNEKIFFRNSLFQKAEERNDEAIAFFDSISEMRKLYRYDDAVTNPGYISPSVVKNNALLNKEITIVVYFEALPEAKMTSCKMSRTANEATAKCMAEYNENFNNVGVLCDQYVLKVVGYTTYIHGETKLSDYVHVQECVKRGKNLIVSLVRRNHVNIELSRDREDDDGDFSGTYFNTPSSLSVSEEGLIVLLDTYNKEAAELIKNVSKTHEVQYIPDKLIQIVKAISNVLAQVELLQIQDAINALLALKRTDYRYRALHRQNYNEYLNPMHFDMGRFKAALEKLTAGVYSLIRLYCRAFQTQFKLHDPKQQNSSCVDVYERIDPRTLTDNFIVHLASVHRLPSEWKYDYEELKMTVGLYYGGHLLCPVKHSRQSKPCKGFFEHIRFDDLLEFNIAVKKIPRETKIGHVLYGLNAAKKGTDGKTMLGWFTCNIYDYKGFLLSGSKLFGLLSDDDFNPGATCATNYLQQSNTTIVKVDFQAYHTEVIFPEPILLPLNETQEDSDYSKQEIAYIRDTILEKNITLLSKEEKNIIWESRHALLHLPKALKYVLVSVPSWDSENVFSVHLTLSCWPKLRPNDALELLHADYPDKVVREKAVLWLTDIPDDELCDCLLEIVQALKYEAYHNSPLARFLIKRALVNPRMAHFLFWHLKYYVDDRQFCQRFQLVLSGLLSVCGARMQAELYRQNSLIVSLSNVAAKVKKAKDTSRTFVLQKELRELNGTCETPVRLPFNPAIKISAVSPEDSSYFASNTIPLKLVCQNVDPRGLEINAMFKMGDDLRKDLVTQLMFGVMNKLWLNEGLDLKMMLYKVLPTAPLAGLIEIVPDAATFREIHVQYGLTGSFKDDSLALWLQRFNSSEHEYQKAVENFTASVAGYCVATYLLGIGDRHNDNIMLTRNGHVFHIDFSKFMGNVQKFGNIKRDRVPFVLTPDMAYVINNGETTTQNFQKFVEYCCNAFNVIRKNEGHILNLLGLMVYSGIAYLSQKEDLSFVRDALQLHLSDEEATMYFTRLLENSLASRSTQLNFFIHNVATMKNATETMLRSTRSSPLFSFANKVHSVEEDGVLVSARVVDFQKRYIPDKHYVFVVNVTRKNQKGPKFVFRRFEDFHELHGKLSYIFNMFSGTVLPELPAKIYIGRSQIHDVAIRRRRELDGYLHAITSLPDVFASEIVYSFLHSYIKDVEEERRFAEFVTLLQDGRESRIGGKLKLSMVYKDNSFRILVMHASNLIPRRLQGLANSYIKCYLLPDPMKQSKAKTKICRKSLNPTFNETMTYDMPLELLQKKVLQITAWDYDHLVENEFLGGINFVLSTFDLKNKRMGWFTLTDVRYASSA